MEKEKEFKSLSEKIFTDMDNQGELSVKDIKESIEKLREELPNLSVWNRKRKLNMKIWDIINEIFGPKLTKEIN